MQAVLRRMCLLLMCAGLLGGCSRTSRDRMWRAWDPLGYSRANDAPYLYREKSPSPGNYRSERAYHLDDPF